ncbi:MAG: CDP-alcohol phosphatidyltransferase family protein [Candidatus Ranarchaeia archaeon]
MVLGRLRENYQRIMDPIGRALGRTGLTPNTITMISVLVSVIACWFLYLQEMLLGGLFIIMAGVVDMFDGAIARATGTASPAGATFDHVMDRYAEFFIVIGVILSTYTEWWIGLFCIFSMIMASFTRAKAESVGGLTSCTVGIAERQEKLGIIIAGIFVSALYPGNVFPRLSVLSLCLLAVAALSQITVIQRLRYTFKKQGSHA